MPGMKQSLPGLFRNTEIALRSSKDDMACAMAFSLGQLIDNLRVVKEGVATIDEFFEYYVFDSERRNLADSVEAARYECMRDEPDDDENAADAA
jgi:hypothetical protein